MALDCKLSEVKFSRPKCTYRDRSENFVLTDRTFNRQYASYYCARYNSMFPVLKRRAEEKWGESHMTL